MISFENFFFEAIQIISDTLGGVGLEDSVIKYHKGCQGNVTQ